MNMAIKHQKFAKPSEADQSIVSDQMNTSHKRKRESTECTQSFKKTKSFKGTKNEYGSSYKMVQKSFNKRKFAKPSETDQNTVSDQKNTNRKRKGESTECTKSFKKTKSFKRTKNEHGSSNKMVQKRFNKRQNPQKHQGESKLSSPEKTNIFSMKKKERKAFRQKSKKNFDLAKQLKMLWEEVRRDDIKEARKLQLLKEISTLVKGHALQLIFAHDTARVIECLVALGTEVHRSVLFEELKESIILLTKSRYAKFFVIKLLKYGTQEQKAYVMKAFHGKVIHLMKHAEAAVVVETAFNECANATQRVLLVQEFYGPQFLYFKDADVHNLMQLIEAKPDKKAPIIEHMKSSLEKILEKGAHKHSIIHYVLREFMTNAHPTSRSDMIESLQKVAAEILHTKDGCRVVMSCIWHGSAKARKVMIKSFKNHVSKIAQEEYGHMALLAIFDCVDDTRLVEKCIISEIAKDGKAIFLNQYGRKVVAYLVSPRDPLYFHPDVINILKQGDGNITSKKDSELRKSELRDISSPLLLKVLLDNMQDLLLDNACCLLVATLLKHSSGDPTEVFRSIARLASPPYFPPEKNSMHFIESNSSSLLLKKLIVADKGKKGAESDSFSEVLINEIPHGNLHSWIQCNRSAFLLVSLLETGIPSVVERVREEMKIARKILLCKTYEGAKILSKMLIKSVE